MLAAGMRDHAAPLSASFLATYRERLWVALRVWGVLEVADLVAHLPPGCAFWQAVGGPRAWSDDQHMLMLIEFRLRELQWQGAGNKSAPRPEPRKPPDLSGAEKAEEQRIADAHRRFMRRFG